LLRLRLLRIFLPLAVLLLLVLLALQLQPKERVHTNHPGESALPAARAEGIAWSLFDGARRSYSALVDFARQEAETRFRLDGVHRLEVEREGEPPLIIRADAAGVDGSAGQRRVDLRGGVEVAEGDHGLKVTVPELDIDEAAGEARSVGPVRVEAPSYHGEAESIVYGLRGQPTLGLGIRLTSAAGAELSALRVRLNDGTRDFELEGDVRLTRPPEFLSAGAMRIWRSEDDRVRRVDARDNVSGAVAGRSGGLILLEGDQLQLDWGAAGDIERLRLKGRALLRQGRHLLAASSIEANRLPHNPSLWDVRADGHVRAQGAGFADGELSVQARRLRATLLDGAAPVTGAAAGDVRFHGPETSAEAEDASYAAEGTGAIVLRSGSRRRARLARDRTRVAAERIDTDRSGIEMTATGRVEATLLPTGRSQDQLPTRGLFRDAEAVHFVADRLQSTDSGGHLVFTGGVRGWQGTRTLSASRVLLDQRRRVLLATDGVSTRIPRQEQLPSVSEGDFIQVSADQLEYSEADARAVYSGHARIRQAEGWIEAERLEIDLDREQDSGIRQIRAFTGIRFEYQPPGDAGATVPVTGEGDRVAYAPAEQTLWLYGDTTRASVRRGPEGGDTASGRVIRYRVDLGTLQVESGEQDNVRIVTPGGGSR
jgi:lipopolysaccharide transport protein LptA